MSNSRRSRAPRPRPGSPRQASITGISRRSGTIRNVSFRDECGSKQTCKKGLVSRFATWFDVARRRHRRELARGHAGRLTGRRHRLQEGWNGPDKSNNRVDKKTTKTELPFVRVCQLRMTGWLTINASLPVSSFGRLGVWTHKGPPAGLALPPKTLKPGPKKSPRVDWRQRGLVGRHPLAIGVTAWLPPAPRRP